jgi:phosphoribosylaminoimidazolecarboxamide formyltransferase/IMP cyclohydrolase
VLQAAGVKAIDISEITGFPEIMDGRVKTLHPKVHGGLLGVRTDSAHVKAAADNQIGWIDMVVVNLYEFENHPEIENIDIGGPSMIRSAAKNYEHVAVVTDPADYKKIMEVGGVSKQFARELAAKAFARTAAYDSAIANWFGGNGFFVHAKLQQELRYGENPHQKAAFYITGNCPYTNQLQGKELSYNNINDTDAAWLLVNEFTQPAAAIIKHANPCGVAVGANLLEAYTKALAADPVSAFGGIIALNKELDSATATEIAKLFAEVIIAPSIADEAAEILSQKKNLRVLIANQQSEIINQKSIKSVQGGLLVQDIDNANITEKDIKIVSQRVPTTAEMADLLFAFKVVKHVKSNAIVTAKNGISSGIGAGQMNRVGSVALACAGDANKNIAGHVLASDAFFPFADGVEAAAKAGITAIIHPGGSVRDAEVIAAANAANIAMVVTGVRVFKH